MSEFFEQIFSLEYGDYSLVIEDDGRVCYAYLLKGQEIIGDVWLYNQDKTPAAVNWKSSEELPFLNPSEFVNEGYDFNPIQSTDQLSVQWKGHLGSLEKLRYILTTG